MLTEGCIISSSMRLEDVDVCYLPREGRERLAGLHMLPRKIGIPL